MRFTVIGKFEKLFVCALNSTWRRALLRGVASAIEHDLFFRHLKFNTVIDVGANSGQFSLVMRKNFPEAYIYSFEPLKRPFRKLVEIFRKDPLFIAFNSAIGPDVAFTQINVSGRDDSSSLLPISDLQDRVFPGTSAVRTERIHIGDLSAFLKEDDILRPCLLKLDVQGFELDALKGCRDFFKKVDMVYCECSFLELYVGQALSFQVINYMSDNNFHLEGINNVAFDDKGRAVQADFVFVKNEEDL